MATLTWLLDVNAPNAAKTFDEISLRMKDLDASLKKTREISVGDRSAMATIAKLQLQADRFGNKLQNMDLTIDGAARAEAQLLGLEASADRLKEKLGDVKVGGFLGRLRGLLPGGGGGLFGLLGGGGAAAAQGGSSAFGSLGSLGQLGQGLQGAGMGTAAVLAALLAPVAIPLALGGGVGLGGGLLAATLGTKGLAALQKDRQAVASARAALAGSSSGGTATQHLALQRALAQQARDQRQFGAFAPFGRDVTHLGATVTGTLAGALTSQGWQGPAGPHGVAVPSFLTGLERILRQLGGFIKSIGPQLGDLFRASLPFVAAFVKFLEQAAKLLLPAFVQMLKEMTPFLPVIVKGLLNIVKGFVGFLNAIGPSGMKASARIFVVLTEAMAAVLVALGHTINWLTENIPTWVRKIHNEWDVLRHATAVIFDNIRHNIAATWDQIFSNTIGRVIRGGHDIEREWNTWTHNIRVIFDAFRHSAAVVWDAIWNNTVGRTQRGIHDVLHWVSTLPGGIKNFFNGAKTWLFQAGKDVIQGLWNGLLFIWHKVTSFISGIAGWIKAHKGPLALDARLLEPAGRALMSGLHIGLLGGFAPISAFISGAAAKLGSIFSHLGGSGINRWAPLVLQVLKMLGQPAGALGIVLSQIATESGGNPRAINLWDINAKMGDPSRGLLQVIGTTFNAYAGPFRSRGIYDPLANVFAGLNYAIHRYGRTGWMSVLGHGHGYATGGLITEPIVGLGLRTGSPYSFGERGIERVTPGAGPAHGGPVVHIDNFNSYDATDPVLLGQRLSFAITAASLGS